jgi:hypothetical protein
LLRGDKEVRLNEIEITEARIAKAIDELKLNNTAGTDMLDSTFIKYSKDSLLNPLKLMFERSLDLGEIPGQWKEANISAIHKKGSKK